MKKIKRMPTLDLKNDEYKLVGDERGNVILLLCGVCCLLESELPVRVSGETFVIVELIEILFCKLKQINLYRKCENV
eukprot:295815-Amphidinium_carterae.1